MTKTLSGVALVTGGASGVSVSFLTTRNAYLG